LLFADLQSRTAKQSSGWQAVIALQAADSQSKVIATGLEDPGGSSRGEGRKKEGEEKPAGERWKSNAYSIWQFLYTQFMFRKIAMHVFTSVLKL
jgi:hypothetical protein